MRPPACRLPRRPSLKLHRYRAERARARLQDSPDFSLEGASISPNIPLRLLITLAWNLNPGDEIFGAPKWLDSANFDLVAKASTLDAPTGIDDDDFRVMLRALLEDRFKLETHYEDRPMNAYTLVAAKQKLKKADPANRTGCKTGPSQAPRDPGDFTPPPFVATCQNMTMAQFAEQLQNIAPTYIRYPVLDATGLEGCLGFQPDV